VVIDAAGNLQKINGSVDEELLDRVFQDAVT